MYDASAMARNSPDQKGIWLMALDLMTHMQLCVVASHITNVSDHSPDLNTYSSENISTSPQ